MNDRIDGDRSVTDHTVRAPRSARLLLILAALGILSITASTTVIFLGQPGLGLLLLVIGLGALFLAIYLFVR